MGAPCSRQRTWAEEDGRSPIAALVVRVVNAVATGVPGRS
jgi:hypothetical protein